jgi:hypothetical protein
MFLEVLFHFLRKWNKIGTEIARKTATKNAFFRPSFASVRPFWTSFYPKKADSHKI